MWRVWLMVLKSDCLKLNWAPYLQVAVPEKIHLCQWADWGPRRHWYSSSWSHHHQTPQTHPFGPLWSPVKEEYKLKTGSHPVATVWYVTHLAAATWHIDCAELHLIHRGVWRCDMKHPHSAWFNKIWLLTMGCFFGAWNRDGHRAKKLNYTQHRNISNSASNSLPGMVSFEAFAHTRAKHGS